MKEFGIGIVRKSTFATILLTGIGVGLFGVYMYIIWFGRKLNAIQTYTFDRYSFFCVTKTPTAITYNENTNLHNNKFHEFPMIKFTHFQRILLYWILAKLEVLFVCVFNHWSWLRHSNRIGIFVFFFLKNINKCRCIIKYASEHNSFKKFFISYIYLFVSFMCIILFLFLAEIGVCWEADYVRFWLQKQKKRQQ